MTNKADLMIHKTNQSLPNATQKKSTISRSIALADESISNNNLTIDELVKTAYNV